MGRRNKNKPAKSGFGKPRSKDATTEADRNDFIVKLWTQHYIPAGLEAKLRFTEDFNKVEKYFESDHMALYEQLSGFMNPEGLLCLTVNLAQEVRGYMGPHLYARNPTRTVTPKSKSGPMRCLAKIQETYLNATPEDTKLKAEFRKVVDEALIAGRGAIQTVKDPWTGLVTSRHVPIRDVFLDPDARCLDDCQWIAIRRQEPLHVLKLRREPKKPGEKEGVKWDTRDLKPDVAAPSDEALENFSESGRRLHEDVARLAGKTSHIVRYYEVYSKMGTGLGKGKLPSGEDQFRGEDDGNRFTKLVLVPGHDRPLFKGDWDLSLYLDDDWPVGFMDFTPTLVGSKDKNTNTNNGGLWPISIMKLAIGHQEAIDVLVTRWLNDLFQRSRMIGVVPAEHAEAVKTAFESGDPWSAIKLANETTGIPTRDIFNLLTLGQVDPTYEAQLRYHESKFGQVTGMLPALMGGGEGHQIRSATEADLRDRNSRSRIEDMNSVTEATSSGSARREGIAVRANLSVEEVERVVAERLELGKWKVEVIADGEVLSFEIMGQMFESAGTYFDSQEQAAQAAMQVQQRGEMVAPGQFMARPIPVTVSEVWADTEADPKELALQLGYSVQSGSARQLDVNMKISQAEMIMARVGEPALQLQQFDVYNRVLGVLFKAFQVPDEDQVLLDAQGAMALVQQQKQQAEQQQQQAQAQQQAQQQHELQKIQVEQQAKAQGGIALTAAKTAMDPVGSGGVR